MMVEPVLRIEDLRIDAGQATLLQDMALEVRPGEIFGIIGESGAARIGDSIMLIDGLGQSDEGEIVARQEFAGYWEYLLDDEKV